MVYNKIGFHFGSEAAATGWGDYVRALDAAGIPAVLMSMAGEGFGDIKALWDEGSTVPHVVCIRYGGVLGNHDVPPYGTNARQAAVDWWNWYKPRIGPDAYKYKDRIVLKMGNELDKNEAEWLAGFNLELYDILQNDPDGPWRMAAFNYSAGEPEPAHWRGPVVQEYLRLCAADPIGAAIGLHEYSYQNVLDIGDLYQIGRFLDLFAACDEMGIARPSVYIHEFGWRQDTLPGKDTAMAQIPWAAELYAKYPEVKGAGIWTLQGSGSYAEAGKPHISQLTQPLIEPMTQYSLTARFPDPEPVEPPIDPPDGGGGEPVAKITRTRIQGADILRTHGATEVSIEFMTYHADGRITIPGPSVKVPVPPGTTKVRADVYIDEEFEIECVENPNPPDPPGTIEIADIVDDLPKHATLKYATRPLDGISILTIHHTVSPPDRSIESIAAYHVNSNGWPGIGYHFVIKDDGRIFQVNRLETKSYHAGSTAAPGDENAVSVGIALQGDFTNAPPPQAQQDAARALVADLSGLLPSVTAVWGHRQMPGASTQCPGNTFGDWLPYIVAGMDEVALKFEPGDRVEVVGDTLNIRNAPYGELVGTQQPGAAGTVIQGGIANGSFIWWSVDFDSGADGWCAENWLQKSSGTKPTDPPAPPTGQVVDMTQYYLPPNGRAYGDISIKSTNWGQGDVRQQLQLHGGYCYVTKGNEIEKRIIDGDKIYFILDDSPGDGKYYLVHSPTGWIPTRFAVGQTFTRQETATFYYKSNCQPTGEMSNWTNQMLFKAFYPTWTSPGGITLANVAHLQWLVNGVVEEDYYLAPGLGYAGWKNRHGRESWIKELIPYTDQQPNKFPGGCYHDPIG